MTVGELKAVLADIKDDDIPVNLYRQGVEYYYGIERIQCCYNTIDGFKDIEIRIVEDDKC